MRVFSCVRKNVTDQRDLGEDTLDALMVVKSRPDGVTSAEEFSDDNLVQLKSAYYNLLKKYR